MIFFYCCSMLVFNLIFSSFFFFLSSNSFHWFCLDVMFVMVVGNLLHVNDSVSNFNALKAKNCIERQFIKHKLAIHFHCPIGVCDFEALRRKLFYQWNLYNHVKRHDIKKKKRKIWRKNHKLECLSFRLWAFRIEFEWNISTTFGFQKKEIQPKWNMENCRKKKEKEERAT